MKVIDIQIYRHRRAIMELEKKIADTSLSPSPGSARLIKTYFKEWVQRKSTGT